MAYVSLTIFFVPVLLFFGALFYGIIIQLAKDAEMLVGTFVLVLWLICGSYGIKYFGDKRS